MGSLVCNLGLFEITEWETLSVALFGSYLLSHSKR